MGGAGRGGGRVGEVVQGHEPHCQEIKDIQIKSNSFFYPNRRVPKHQGSFLFSSFLLQL